MDVEWWETGLWLALYCYCILEILWITVMLVSFAMAADGYQIVFGLLRSSQTSFHVYLVQHLAHYGSGLVFLMLPQETRQALHGLNLFSIGFLWWFCYMFLVDVATTCGTLVLLHTDIRRRQDYSFRTLSSQDPEFLSSDNKRRSTLSYMS